MPRTPAGKGTLSTLIPNDLHQAAREYSAETGIPLTRIVADALRLYLREKGKLNGN